jgi:hypothetical protein
MADIPKPAQTGLTPEAMEALGLTEQPMPEAQPFADDTDLASDDSDAIVDAIIVPDDEAEEASSKSGSRRKPLESAKTDKPRAAKAGPPSLDEWTRFFSRVLLRVVCDWYISWAMRGVDEDALTDREIERLVLTDDEKQTIAVPFAELSNKSRFMRKHGRLIVSSGDSFNAIVVLGAWFSRVNRIAAKHKPKVVKGQTVNHEHNGQSTPQGNGYSEAGTNGGRVDSRFRIFPGTG